MSPPSSPGSVASRNQYAHHRSSNMSLSSNETSTSTSSFSSYYHATKAGGGGQPGQPAPLPPTGMMGPQGPLPPTPSALAASQVPGAHGMGMGLGMQMQMQGGGPGVQGMSGMQRRVSSESVASDMGTPTLSSISMQLQLASSGSIRGRPRPQAGNAPVSPMSPSSPLAPHGGVLPMQGVQHGGQGIGPARMQSLRARSPHVVQPHGVQGVHGPMPGQMGPGLQGMMSHGQGQGQRTAALAAMNRANYGQGMPYDTAQLHMGINNRSHSLDISTFRTPPSPTHTASPTTSLSPHYTTPTPPHSMYRRPSVATDAGHSTTGSSDDDNQRDRDDDVNSLMHKFGGSSLTFTVNERPTLNDLLVPHAPSLESLTDEFEAFQAITGWFLGSQEAALSQYAMWKPSVRVHQFVLPRLLHIPRVDLGASAITPKLRRSILLVASMQYRCQYCAAHAAGLGDILKGSWRSQVRAKERAEGAPGGGAGGAPTPGQSAEWHGRPSVGLMGGMGKKALHAKPIIDPADSRNSVRESELLKLVTAASRIPSKVTPELKKNVIAGFGVEGLQMAGSIAGLFGWTNAITDSIGMELGVQDILFAREQIGPNGWTAARHAPAAFNESGDFTEREKMDSKRAEVVPRKGLKRFLDYATVLKHIHAADKLSASWTTQIPTSSKQLDAWLNRHLGFTPAYVQCLVNVETKRAVCLMLWVFLIRSMDDKGDPCVGDEACEWSNGAKALMFYVYCTITGNLLLRGHAAHLAIRRKVPVNILVVAASGGKTHNARLDAALDFIRTSASLKRVYKAESNVRLLDTHQTPGGVMELASTLGLFNMLHRLSAMVAPEPAAFEKEVREFLEVFGVVLGMDPKDAAPQSKEERS
ncbi:hypothetical protein HK101_004020, partial [Irineochytrium annulatum]